MCNESTNIDEQTNNITVVFNTELTLETGKNIEHRKILSLSEAMLNESYHVTVM